LRGVDLYPDRYAHVQHIVQHKLCYRKDLHHSSSTVWALSIL
jgi:hypothetical protein